VVLLLLGRRRSRRSGGERYFRELIGTDAGAIGLRQYRLGAGRPHAEAEEELLHSDLLRAARAAMAQLQLEDLALGAFTPLTEPVHQELY
jgi:hypothetical protein